VVEYTQAQRLIVAGVRLRDALAMPAFDAVELQESVRCLLALTGTTDLPSALDVLSDVEFGQGPT